MPSNAMSRRAFLALPPLVAVAACTAEDDPRPRPRPDPDAVIRRQVAADVRRLLTAYTSTLERHPEDADLLRPLMADHEVHLRALAAMSPATSSPSATTSRSVTPAETATASPSGSASASADTRSSARAALVRLEGEAARARVGQLTSASPPLARLIASIGASEAAHSALLSRPA